MSRLGELIRTLCPDGVEYKQIGELCDKVQRVNWEGNRKYEYIDLSSVDIKSHSIIQTTTIDKDNAPSRAQQIVRENDIIFGTTRPTLKRISYITKEYDGQVCSTGFCVVHINSNFVVPKWVYYLMCDTRFNNYVKANEEGANYPCIADGKIKRYEIPVPPMEVQEEIVRLLDKYTEVVTELESKLEAELEARKKQYEHYRDTLLEFTPPVSENVELVPFSNVCKYIRGITYNKGQEVNDNREGIMILRANNITLKTNTVNFDDVKVIDINSKVKEEQILRKNDILMCVGSGSKEHIGKVAFIGEDINYGFGGFMAVIRIMDKLDSRYLFHVLAGRYFKDYLEKATAASTIININSSIMNNFLIPIPPIEEQEKIVSILDKFEAFCTDLCEGLPAEIEARRRQYEHYRDRLLTFRRKSA